MENQAMKKRGERLYGNGELPYKFHFYTPLDSNDQQLNCKKKNPKKLENLCPFWNPLSHERLLQRRDGKSGGVSCRSVDGLAGKAGAIALLDSRVKMWFANGIIVLPVILICL